MEKWLLGDEQTDITDEKRVTTKKKNILKSARRYEIGRTEKFLNHQKESIKAEILCSEDYFPQE